MMNKRKKKKTTWVKNSWFEMICSWETNLEDSGAGDIWLKTSFWLS